MSDTSNDAAFPIPEDFIYGGLTKLEYFTAAALQGMCANGWRVDDHLASEAVTAAKLTLMKLEKESE